MKNTRRKQESIGLNNKRRLNKNFNNTVYHPMKLKVTVAKKIRNHICRFISKRRKEKEDPILKKDLSLYKR